MHFNLIWVFFEKFGSALISMGAFFVYAYALNPMEFGTAIVVLSAAQFLAIMISIFYEDPLVQMKDIDDSCIDTAFWGSILTSLIAMAFMYTGFYISGYHTYDPQILALVGFASLEILLTNIGTIYVAQLRRDGHFKILAFRVLCGRIGGSIFGILAAVNGFGPWAILIQSITSAALQTIILVYSVRALPGFHIRFSYLRYFCSFGSALALKRLSWDLLVRASPMIATITLSTSAAGHVAFAWRIVELFRSSIVSGLISYLLPHFSRMQDSKERMAKEFVSVTALVAFAMTPIFLGLLVTAPMIVTTIFEEKWNAAIPIIQLFCVSALLGGYRSVVPITLTASGHPSAMIITYLLTTFAALSCMFCAPFFGMHVFAIAFILYTLTLLIFSLSIIQNIIGLNTSEQLFPIVKYCIPGVLMACTLVIIQVFLPLHFIGQNLFVQIALGVALFSMISVVFYKDDLCTWKDGFLTQKPPR